MGKGKGAPRSGSRGPAGSCSLRDRGSGRSHGAGSVSLAAHKLPIQTTFLSREALDVHEDKGCADLGAEELRQKERELRERDLPSEDERAASALENKMLIPQPAQGPGTRGDVPAREDGREGELT